ncbi:hypothetical protein E4P35_11010 [Thiopseudomonas sp. 4R-3cl]|nr:hypothetical protein E4P35_11010 [Thiopseudomonas sp. 4R-3cl]
MTTKRTKETITLGSGKLYALKHTGQVIPPNTTLEVNSNLLGYIKGGAELEYTPEFYDAIDDLGIVQKSVVTGEEVLLRSGIMTWNGDTLAKLSATARVTEAAGKRTLKIGGLGNQTNDKYILRFVHTDVVDGDVRITIVGQNRSGFTLAFTKDDETVIDAEFRAQPSLDAESTLLLFEETIGTK